MHWTNGILRELKQIENHTGEQINGKRTNLSVTTDTHTCTQSEIEQTEIPMAVLRHFHETILLQRNARLGPPFLCQNRSRQMIRDALSCNSFIIYSDRPDGIFYPRRFRVYERPRSLSDVRSRKFKFVNTLLSRLHLFVLPLIQIFTYRQYHSCNLFVEKKIKGLI